MLILHSRETNSRGGNIIPLTAILLVFILGMVAFAVDTSWIVLTRSELQNVADAAALAGATTIANNYVLYSLPGQSSANKTAYANQAVSSAKTAAVSYANSNGAGSVSNLTLLDSDIDVGFTDASGNFSSYNGSSSSYPNTVKVKMRRDSSANTTLKLFFAPAIGVSSMDVLSNAGAAVYAGNVDSFKVSSSTLGLLPVTYDVNYWNNFIKTGQDADGTSNKDSSGNPVLQVYPSIKATGNFGLISLNNSHVGANTISNWIYSGPSSSDIQALRSSSLIPLSSHNPAKWDWQGLPGFKASNVMDMNNCVGKTYLLPLFKPVDSNVANYTAGTGNGANYFYNIVQFVGVKIVAAPSSNKQVWIQPALVSDTNFVFDSSSVAPLGTSSTLSTTSSPAKLTN